MNKFHILIVDDHMVVRKGLSEVLRSLPSIDTISEADSGEAAIEWCQKKCPDIILMDMKMPGMSGDEATKVICENHPHVHIIGLSTFSDQAIIDDMSAAGASGYLPKTVSAQDLSFAIETVVAGGKHFMDGTPAEPDDAQDIIRDIKLGHQQKRVLALLTKGMTNPEIAQILGISKPTARYHVSAILEKLDVSNRAEAAAFAMRHSIVSSEDI